MTVAPLITKAQVEDAVEATLRHWLGTYLRAMEEQTDYDDDTLILPQRYTHRNEFEYSPEDPPPVCIITCPGLYEEPEKHGTCWSARWAVTVTMVVAADDWENTRRLGDTYGAAVRAVILGHADLLGFSDGGTWWLHENTVDIPTSERSLGANTGVYWVQTNEAIDVSTRALVPSDDPPGPKPLVTKPNVQLQLEELT